MANHHSWGSGGGGGGKADSYMDCRKISVNSETVAGPEKVMVMRSEGGGHRGPGGQYAHQVPVKKKVTVKVKRT